MGFLAETFERRTKAAPASGGGLWARAFGTNKESPQPLRPERDANSWAKSVSSIAGMQHFLAAMRSSAPGGWTDDRWEQSGHQVGAAYVAVHRICTRLQQSSFQVSHNDPSHVDGKRPVLPSDPPEGDRHCRPYDLVRLLQRPNSQDYFGKLMYRWGQQKLLTGSAITWMVPNELGYPMELYPLETCIAVPMPVITGEFPQGAYRIQPVYPYGPFSSYPMPTSAAGTLIDSRWTFKFFYPHPRYRYEGYSPQTGMRLQLDELEAMDRSRWYKMKRSSNPDAVLDMKDMESGSPVAETEIMRMLAQWESAMQGAENHGKLLVPPAGTELKQFGTTPKEMDYGQSWEQLMGFALGGFGITKPAAGMVDNSSYAVLYATLRQLNLITLDPEAADFGAVLTRHLAPFFGDDLIVEITCPRIDDHDIAFAKVDKLSALKGLPKSVVKLAFNLLDLPPDEEAMDDLAAAGEEEQQAAPGMPAPAGQQDGQPEPFDSSKENVDPFALVGITEDRAEPEEITQTRPGPDKLGEGSLGPRKALLNGLAKTTRNGRHRK